MEYDKGTKNGIGKKLNLIKWQGPRGRVFLLFMFDLPHKSPTLPMSVVVILQSEW